MIDAISSSMLTLTVLSVISFLCLLLFNVIVICAHYARSVVVRHALLQDTTSQQYGNLLADALNIEVSLIDQTGT
jgi:hypothetical protein